MGSQAARIYLRVLLFQLLLSHLFARGPSVVDGSLRWSPAATPKIEEERVEAPSTAFRVLLEAEADATVLALKLYSRKRDLLAAKLAVALARQENPTLEEQQQSDDGHNRTRRVRIKAGGQRVFSDWLELRDSIRLDGARFKLDAASADGLDADNEGNLVQMIALHANPKPMGRSPHPPNARKPTFDRDAPLLQFVAVMERKTSTLHMYHPVTHELVWQAQLPEIRDVASFSVASDRRSHLAILTSSRRLALYSLRVWHHGRAISGGFRRVDPLGPRQCLLTSYDSLLDRPGLPWWPPVPQSSPAPGKHLHIDFELVFRLPAAQSVPELTKYPSAAPIGSNDRSWSGNVVVTARFRHNFAITSDSNGTLSFFHTENGTYAGNLIVSSSRQPVTQFEPMAGGIVALSIRNHVHFVDVASRRAVGAVCDVPASQTITSIKADPSSPFTIYAGLSSGRGLTFRLRQVGLSWRSQSDEEPSHDRPECVLVSQLRSHRESVKYKSHRADRAAPPAQLTTKTVIDVLPGYLIMSTDSRLVLFQLTTGSSGHPVYLSERDMLSSHRDSVDQIVALSAAANAAEHPAALVVHVAVGASGAIRLDVYASLQPPPPPVSLNLSWMRFPVVLLCVVAALFWQQRAQGGGQHAHHLPHGDVRLPAELFGANSRRANWRKTKS
jgi:hypothetical protein